MYEKARMPAMPPSPRARCCSMPTLPARFDFTILLIADAFSPRLIITPLTPPPSTREGEQVAKDIRFSERARERAARDEGMILRGGAAAQR